MLTHESSMALMCQDPEAVAGPVPHDPTNLSSYLFSRRWFVENIRREGIVQLIPTANDPTEFAQFIASDEHHYTMNGQHAYAAGVAADLSRHLSADGFKQVESLDYGDVTDAELTANPFVLAIRGEQRGNGKYLIENSRQVKTLRRFVDDLLQGNTGSLEVRPYLETPGKRFTTYRVLTASTGTESSVLAAGLNVSAHSKDVRRVVVDPTGSNPLETPGDYFLQAADVRSNLSQGGFCIPLMGEGCQAWQPGTVQHEVLAAHGIDPSCPTLPGFIAEQSRNVARTQGRATGIAQGQDYLQTSESPADSHLLESNVGPGLVTYQACHNPEGTWGALETQYVFHASLLRHYVSLSYDLALRR